MQMRQVFIFTLGSGRSYLGMKRTVIFVTCSFFFSSLPSGKILDNFPFSYCNFQLCQHTYVQVESHFRIFCHISSPFSTVQDVVYCYNLNSCQVDTFIKLAGAPVYPPPPRTRPRIKMLNPPGSIPTPPGPRWAPSPVRGAVHHCSWMGCSGSFSAMGRGFHANKSTSREVLGCNILPVMLQMGSTRSTEFFPPH